VSSATPCFYKATALGRLRALGKVPFNPGDVSVAESQIGSPDDSFDLLGSANSNDRTGNSRVR